MVQYTTSGSGQYLNEDWHQARWEAISTTFSLDEWGPIEIEQYDLDDLEFSRKYKDSAYLSEARIVAEGGAVRGFDVRDHPVRD